MSRIGRNLARLAALSLFAALAGCNDSGTSYEASSPASPASTKREAGEARLAYQHALTVGLSADRVGAHYTAVRDRCLNEAALRCVLIRSSISEGDTTPRRPVAQLEVRLPHVSVPTFIAVVMAQLPGEPPGEVILRNQSTRADDLTQAVADVGRRLAQATDYRERLTALSNRSDSQVEDLVKIANELSQVQSQIEDLEGRQRGLKERIETKVVAVNFRSDRARESVLLPVQTAWERSGRTFGESAGAALRFAVASLPWLPLLAIGLLLIRWVWRLRRRKKPPLAASER